MCGCTLKEDQFLSHRASELRRNPLLPTDRHALCARNGVKPMSGEKPVRGMTGSSGKRHSAFSKGKVSISSENRSNILHVCTPIRTSQARTAYLFTRPVNLFRCSDDCLCDITKIPLNLLEPLYTRWNYAHSRAPLGTPHNLHLSEHLNKIGIHLNKHMNI